MCGRYYRRSDKQRIAEAIHAGVPSDFVLPDWDYNVAPTTFQPVILTRVTERNNTPVRAFRAQICPSTDWPMLRQGFNMLIDRIGGYSTNGYDSAHVFGLRGVNCIGYIIQPDGSKTAAVWHSKDGTRINGPADENLARFVPHNPKGPKAR